MTADSVAILPGPAGVVPRWDLDAGWLLHLNYSLATIWSWPDGYWSTSRWKGYRCRLPLSLAKAALRAKRPFGQRVPLGPTGKLETEPTSRLVVAFDLNLGLASEV